MNYCTAVDILAIVFLGQVLSSLALSGPVNISIDLNKAMQQLLLVMRE